ncbi:trypsin-like peptidase domain-containing protein [Mycoplasmatota bacterium]|nr:trypsin-like peptidase domain-containing protein [Mycoplasmatota bacterium]
MKKSLIILVLLLSGCTAREYKIDTTEIESAVQEYLDENLKDIEADVDININELNDLMTGLIKEVDKSVIGVVNYNAVDQPNGTGSGVVYKCEDDYYYAITNHHVVEASSRLEVYFVDKSFVEAELVGVDSDTDLAVIKFKNDSNLVETSNFGDAKELIRGQLVIAVGSPSGFTYFNSATMGIVSGIDRFVGIKDTDDDGIDDVFVKMLQHDAAINPGNSGGPLFNMEGEIVGINSLKLVSDQIEGMGFSIPVDITLRVIEDLEEYGEVKRARLGVWIGDVRFWEEAPVDLDRGCYVSDIVLGGPVDTTSDLEIGDIIVGFEDQNIDGLSQLKDLLFQYHPGETVKIRYYREGEYFITTVVLGEM